MEFYATIDASRLDRAMAEAAKETSRSIEDCVNTKGLFIVIRWINEVPGNTNESIAKDLAAASKVAPDVPVKCILTNKQRKSKGLRGLNGNKMTEAAERFVRRRQATKNRLKASLLPAKRKLSAAVDSKRGAPKQTVAVRQRGKDEGYGIPAKGSSYTPQAVLASTVTGHQGSESRVSQMMHDALQRAVDAEADDTEKHVLEKRLKEMADKFNAS